MLSAFVLFAGILMVLTPYFTDGFSDLRQQKEKEENYQKVLMEQKLTEEAIQKNYLMGIFDPARRTDFILIPSEYSLTPNRIYMRKEAYEAYLKMRQAAERAGVEVFGVCAEFGRDGPFGCQYSEGDFAGPFVRCGVWRVDAIYWKVGESGGVGLSVASGVDNFCE